MGSAGTCLSRDNVLLYFPAFNLIKDGTVRHYVVQDSPGLPEYDILGKLACFWTVFDVRHGLSQPQQRSLALFLARPVGC